MAPIHKTNHVILHNRYILYIIFFIALGNLLSFAYVNDYYSVAVFVLLAFLTTFFSKNMIVILFVAIVFSNIIKYVYRVDITHIEGFSDSDSDEGFADSDEYVQPTEEPSNTTEPSKNTTKAPSKKKTTEPSKKDQTLEPSNKTTEPSKKEKTTEPSKKEKTSELSLETDNKEKFGQDKDIVYTSEEQKEIDETDKIIISQERILSSINKYKPLLDTLNGLTKNMNDVKSAASIFSSS